MPIENVYAHGIYIEETSTALQPMTTIAAPPVVIGTTFKGASNVPTLITSFAEYVETFGWCGDFDLATIEEVAYCFFNLYNLTPLIVINVHDATSHTKDSTAEATGVATTPFTITAPILQDTLVVKSGTKTLVKNDDYKVSQEGLKVTLTVLKQTNITGDAIQLQYKEWVLSKVKTDDLIGGVDEDGNETGLEVVENVYPRLGLIPGTLIAPKYSLASPLALAMAAKAKNINSVFKTIAISDISTAGVTNYSDVYESKTLGNLVDEFLVVCWPKVGLGDKIYHLSTHVAALMAQVDATHDQIPFESPSNKRLQIDRACLANGTEVYLSKTKANILNGYGICTALNFAGYWRAWGNRTSIYPTTSDPKDSWVPVRRMFSYVGNVLATSFFSRIDMPITKRNVEFVLDSANIWLNGLTARGAILGGRIAFLQENNPESDLLDGKIKFNLYITPPPPARQISFVLEYDVNNLNNLFS